MKGCRPLRRATASSCSCARSSSASSSRAKGKAKAKAGKGKAAVEGKALKSKIRLSRGAKASVAPGGVDDVVRPCARHVRPALLRRRAVADAAMIYD